MEDKIKEILATEVSEMLKIEKLTNELIVLFKDEVANYTACVVKGILKGEVIDG